MKKRNFNKKLLLKKETISKFELSEIIGGGPTDQEATWNAECYTINGASCGCGVNHEPNTETWGNPG